MKLGHQLHKAIKVSLSVLASFVIAVGLLLGGYNAPANAGYDPFIGEIMTTANTYCPQDWAEADGRTLQINQYTPLFALIGITYGGDGRNTFNLPDLRSRVAVGYGQGNGLSRYQLGQTGGQENVALGVAVANAKVAASTDASAVAVVNSAKLQPAAVSPVQPYLALRYCVALNGIFPSRD